MLDKKELIFPFTKQQRLLKAHDFKTVLSSPTVKITNQALGVYVQLQDTTRLGLAITRKHIKTAVQRNRIKRVLRESFRLHYSTLPAAAIIVMSRPALVKLSNQELRNNIDAIWQQLRKKFPSTPAAA